MAKIYKIKSGDKSYMRLREVVAGRWVQYTVNIGKFTAKQWLAAHNAVIMSLTPEQRQMAANTQIKDMATDYLKSSKEMQGNAKVAGINTSHISTNAAAKIEAVFESYLKDFCRPEINSATAISKAKRQCKALQDFLKINGVKEYSRLKRVIISKYPRWRAGNRKDGRAGEASADTINKEINRFKAVIKHGIKYHNWKENYLLDGIRVKATPQNTKSVRPFEIAEVKSILLWLGKYSKLAGSWHLHDMILLALCAGLEAKALNMLAKDWFKPDLGILRVYDKLVSGVIDAKTQNRARDIPLTPILRKIFERGYIFNRLTRTRRASKKGGTPFAAWAESILRKAEQETGIADINLHRFRHTCATMRLSAGWQLIRVSRMLGHSNVNTTASHYAEYDLSASGEGFEGMLKVYGEFVRWLDEGYFSTPSHNTLR